MKQLPNPTALPRNSCDEKNVVVQGMYYVCPCRQPILRSESKKIAEEAPKSLGGYREKSGKMNSRKVQKRISELS